jgi:DMSO/TMAO reductase YedYZ molybdopterin-dependent catalytic subunit
MSSSANNPIHRRPVFALLLLIAACVLFPAANAEAARSLTIDGRVAQKLHLAPADLMAMPTKEAEISFQTGHGAEKATYKGVELWDLVQRAKLADEKGNRPDLHHFALVTGRDGYAVVIALGEIDPDFEGKDVLIAYEKDGEPLGAKDGLRLVVPGDKHGGRAVRDVVRVEIR